MKLEELRVMARNRGALLRLSAGSGTSGEVDSLKELVADIDDAIQRAWQEGEKLAPDRSEYWRGRQDGNAETGSELRHRMWDVENKLRNAQDAAKAMHADKDTRLENLQRAHNELNGTVKRHRDKLDSDYKALQVAGERLNAQAHRMDSHQKRLEYVEAHAGLAITTPDDSPLGKRLGALEREVSTSTFVNIDNHIEGIWKRLEALERQPRVTLDGDGELARKVGALEREMNEEDRAQKERIGKLESTAASGVELSQALNRIDRLERNYAVHVSCINGQKEILDRHEKELAWSRAQLNPLNVQAQQSKQTEPRVILGGMLKDD